MASKDAGAAALKVLKEMQNATGASMEDCRYMLSVCGGDPNKWVFRKAK
jgi:translation elongation factor EF-Ts